MIGCTFRRLLSLSLLFLLLTGCTTKTVITMDDGSVITVDSKNDALVTVKEDNRVITVNNQGKPTLFESILTMMFMDVQTKDKVME